MSARPAYVFYGDDFTGATDTLATLTRAGHRTLLFTDVPTPEHLALAGPLEALGIAGAARAMTPEAMRGELEPVGAFFASTGAPVLHYKTCSTFDSAPQTGSIGTAVAALRRHVRNPLVAIVGGQPNLGRHCLFGNLFAAAQTGGEVHRLDRHPTMSRHPVTPMHEADLRLHLAAQGLACIALFPWPTYEQPAAVQALQLDAALAESPDAVLFDVARPADLLVVGALLRARIGQAPMLVVGPSSVAQALMPDGPTPARLPGIAPADGPVLVLAGSLSPMTASQVASATSYEHIRLDAAALVDGGETRVQADAGRIAESLQRGRHTLVHTGDAGTASRSLPAGTLAVACGRLLDTVLRERPVRRVGIAGGDTSSQALKALDVWGLRYAGALAPGVALCQASSGLPHLDGIELMLKGGQMGAPDLFERLINT